MVELSTESRVFSLQLLDPVRCLAVDEVQILGLALDGFEPQRPLVLHLQALLLDLDDLLVQLIVFSKQSFVLLSKGFDLDGVGWMN